jgi:hypothetical protein
VPDFWTSFGIWIAAFMTLAIFSFLYKDNPFYKLAEHIYVGSSAAYWILYLFYFNIKPLLWDAFFMNVGFEKWILVIPFALSIIMLTRFIPPIAWISRWAIAFVVGIGAGLTITGFIQGILVPWIRATMVPLWGEKSFWHYLNNFIMVTGVIMTLFYFYFSIKHGKILKILAKIGIVFIMIAFGAAFGYTVMARVSLLIGRVNFLLFEWLSFLF